MEKGIFNIIKLFKPQLDRWVIKSLIVSGLTLITTGLTGISWYIQLLLHTIEIESTKRLGQNYAIGIVDWTTVFIGFILLSLGLVVYFLNKYYDKNIKSDFIAITHKSIDNFISPDYDNLLNRKQFNLKEIAIDQTNLYHDGNLEHPEVALISQSDILSRLDILTKNSINFEIGYFGLAHIPLVWELGSILADKFPINYYEYNRNSSNWEKLPKIIKENNLIDIKSKIANSSNENAIIKIEVSYEISDLDIFEVVADYESFITIRPNQTALDKIKDVNSIQEYSKAFRIEIDKLLEKKQIKTIHLFYAGPVSLGFALSRKISKRTDPTVLIYNYTRNNQPAYKWAIKISNSQPEIIQF